MKTNNTTSTLTEEILRFLITAHQTRKSVNLHMFDEYDDARVIGIIERVDPQGPRVMVDGEWFRMSDVLAVEIE